MSLGKVALGIASLVIGANHLRNGLRQMQGLDGISQRYGSPAPEVRVPGRAFMDSGRHVVSTPNGQTAMRMRSYNIRTLDDRIKYLRRLADEGKRDPRVYAFARKAVTKRCGNNWCTPEKDSLAEAKALFGELRRADLGIFHVKQDAAAARALFGNIRKNVRYTSDIMGVDTYQRPAHTLGLRAGDCDDYSSLTCASLGALGIPCRYKVIRTKGSRDWNHIYAQAGLPRANPNRWISMDSSVNMPFGWEAPASMVADSRTFRVG
jgi:transglutaminase-like putative cysteine protease